MLVGTLIAIMIVIVVGVNLIPTITNSITDATAEGIVEEGSAIAGIMDVLPYIFVAIILLGAVAFIGFNGVGGRRDKSESVGETIVSIIKNPKELILRIERSSKKWEQYLNNLDALLGIQTVEAAHTLNGLQLSKDKVLSIDSKNYDWYLEDKSAYEDVFKVIGLHKSNAEENKVYLLGVSGMGRVPFLRRMETNRYLEASCETLIRDSRVKEEVLVA